MTQVTFVKALLPRETVGGVSTTEHDITAVKSAPMIVTEVSMSLVAEAGLMAVTLGAVVLADKAQTGPQRSGFVVAIVVVAPLSVGGLALAVPPSTNASRPIRVTERSRSFFMARPPGCSVPRRPPAAG